MAEYLDAIERARPAIDCAYLIPHGAVRLSVMGMEDRRARPDEIRAMQELIRQSMREGAFGLSTGVIYPPCCFAETAELVELCHPVAEFDLHGYGRIEESMRANLVVFDPHRVMDRATFDDSTQYPQGIEYVIVGGELTVRGETQIESGSGVAVISSKT